MTARKATSVDVARLAGVSQATVSRVFASEERVATATREKVLDAAHSLGYQPNALARSLITQQSSIVGIITHIGSPFYPYVLEKFTQRLQQMGRQVLLFSVTPDQDVDDILPLVFQYRVQALIVTSASLSSVVAAECDRIGIPLILFNRYILGSRANAVSCDNVEGARMVVNLLLDAGHRRLAYIAGTVQTSTNRDREKGFADRMRERGHTEWLLEHGDYSYQLTRAAARRLLDRPDRPDAIFCANDVMAFGAMDAARFDLGLNVPSDVSIVGFDDLPMAAWPAYSLTTVRQPVNRMIDATMDLLSARIDNPQADPVFSLVPGTLIQRGSSRPPPDVQLA